jgi:glycosyltransferase involved in cell wall biosynthesis
VCKKEGLAHAVSRRARHPSAEIEKSANIDLLFTRGYTYIEPAAPHDLKAQLENMASKPMFSIVVPVYNTPPALLTAAIESVKKQWYPHWELILVNDASPARETRAALKRIDDQRIKVLHLQKNARISGATNAGLDAATGDYIVFMDHDDEITPDCLYELAICINREDPDFIYSDEDNLTETGEFTEPHFKPDWSPDTMMSTMFTCHVSCVRRSVQKVVGGLRSEVDGCQDWDFVLRLAEHTSRISHIPKVLYHWRVIPGSIATNIAAKSYVLEASKKVREDALARRGLRGCVEPVPQVPGYFRVAYALHGTPLISIIIPTRDNEKIVRQCLDSIFTRTQYENFEIILLDNGSKDSATLTYLEALQAHEKIKVVRHDAPFNYSELNNIGVRHARGELFLFLNDDTEVLQGDWLERLGGYAQLPHVGAVGAKLLYGDGRQVQHVGLVNLEAGPGHAMLRIDVDAPGYFMRNLLEYNWLAVTGACLMVERAKFMQVDGFAESLPVAYNDVDFGMRLHAAGFYNVVVPAVRLIHHESVSRGVDHMNPEKLARLKREMHALYERNPKYFQYDPFFNINFHPNGINFDIPSP